MAGQLITLNVKSDVARMARNLTSFQQREVPKAVNATVNKVAVTVRKEGNQVISKETGLKVAKLREGIKIIKSNPTTLTAIIKARGKPFNLISFGAKIKKAKKKPIGVTAKPWNKKRFFKGGFILNVTGNPVFKRVGAGKKAIKPMFGPGIVREFIRDKTTIIFNSIARSRFREVFPKELRHRLEKARRR